MLTSRECVCIWFREGGCYISSSIPGQHLKLIRSVWSYSIARICGSPSEYIAELCCWDDLGHLLLIALTAGWEIGEEWLLGLGTCSLVPKGVAMLLECICVCVCVCVCVCRYGTEKKERGQRG